MRVPPEAEQVPDRVDTVADAEALAPVRDTLKAFADKIHEELDENISAANRLHKSLLAQRKRHLEPVEKALAKIRSVVGAYQQRVRLAEAEARAKAEKERQRKEAQEAKRLQRKGVDAAEAREVAAAAAEAMVPAAAPERKPEGFRGTRPGAITVRVTDKMALIKAVAKGEAPPSLLEVSEKDCRNYFRMYERKSPPGVEMKQEQIAI